jgi:hypothetical protein
MKNENENENGNSRAKWVRDSSRVNGKVNLVNERWEQKKSMIYLLFLLQTYNIYNVNES